MFKTRINESFVKKIGLLKSLITPLQILALNLRLVKDSHNKALCGFLKIIKESIVEQAAIKQ